MGDKMGRIHLGRQDLSELQTRKMKGLKRAREAEEEGSRDVEDDDIISDEEASDDGVEMKRPKLA